jgi:hypothetical protein
MPDIPTSSARNPRALVEIVLGRPVDWSQVEDPRHLVETVLETPYEELFDPVHDSPVYLGFARDDHGQIVERDPRFVTQQDRFADDVDGTKGSDLDRYPPLDLESVRHVADLKALVGVAADELPIRRIAPSRAGGWTLEVGQAPAARDAALARLFPKDVLERIWDRLHLDGGWTPSGAQWVDGGRFFDEAAEFFDPVQGGLGDCWLIAAMSSVAWALPYTVAQRSRATGAANDRFTNLFELVDPANGQKHSFEATDEILVWSGTTAPLYGHSSEPGEIWPALVEKAFAMWRAGTTNDHPNLTVLNGGDPVGASAALTGRTPHYTWTAGTSRSDLINLVKAHSSNYRTVDPMTAWTYGSGQDSPDKVNYDDANLVACHAYSVLGWATGPQLLRPELIDFERPWFRGLGAADVEGLAEATTTTREGAAGARNQLARFDATEALRDIERALRWRLTQDYIVLRNPWGFHEATSGNLAGVIPMRDVSFWRSIDLDVVDGVFAIDVATFKRYFAGIGVAL